MLHFKSLSLKRGIFEQFVSDQQKRWTEPTSHKFEGSGSTYSLQTLQYGRFALSEVCFAKRGVHVQNRPWGWIRQRSSAQRFTKISTTFLGRELPVSVLRRLMIRVIIYLDGLLTLWNSTRKIFMVNYSVTFLLLSRLCDKSEEVCIRYYTRNRVDRKLWIRHYQRKR